jgi:hypothetical protein
MKWPVWGALLAGPALFLAIAWNGPAQRGIGAEEIQPYLKRWPRVLERTVDRVVAMPPYEPGAPPRPRWVATSQWPVLGYDGVDRMWPLLIRGYQSAAAAWIGILLGPLLGGGVIGIKRSTVLMMSLVILFTGLFARRVMTSRGQASVVPHETPPGPLALALVGLSLAISYGIYGPGTSGYGFEIASRAAMMAALALAAGREIMTPGRALAVGTAAGLAITSRATVVVVLAPALAVLLVSQRRRMTMKALGPLVACAAVIPLTVLLVAVRLAPLRPEAHPLYELRLSDVWNRLSILLDQIRVQLAWLGDATTLLNPILRGESTFPTGPVAIAAAAGFLVLLASVIRWRRAQESDAERVFVVTTISSVLFGAVLYRSRNQFQLALALEPLFVLAVAAQLRSLPDRRVVGFLVAAFLAFRGGAHLQARALERTIGNPTQSSATQQAAVARMESLGLQGPEILTTSYQHAGVVEGWSDGRVQPTHGWTQMMRNNARDAVWRQLLDSLHPHYLLLTEGVDPFETPQLDPKGISDSLQRVAAEDGRPLVVDQRFPTESGAPGWVLWRIGEPARPPHP